MTFPTPYTVEHYAYLGSPDVVDEIGNVVDVWAEKPKQVAVQGWFDSALERLGTFEQGEVQDVILNAPPSFLPGIHDRIRLDTGEMFEVTGIVHSDKGFHQWKPGNEILLKRATGVI